MELDSAAGMVNSSTLLNISDNAIEKPDFTPRTGLIIAYLVISVVGVVLNILALVIIVCGKKFGNGIKIQLLNLAVTDLLSAFLVSTFTFIALPYQGTDTVCKLHQFTYFWVFYASLLANAEIGIERACAVYIPIKMRSYGRKFVIISIVAIWIVAGLVNTDVIIVGALRRDFYRQNISFCRFGHTELEWDIAKYSIPILIIITAYFFIGVKLHRGELKGVRQSKERHSSKNRKVITMLAVDAIAAALTWSAYEIWLILATIPSTAEAVYTGLAPAICSFIALTNCFITPLIYFTFNRDFKGDGQEIFSRLKSKLRQLKSADDG